MKVTKENLPEIAAIIETLSKNKIGALSEIITNSNGILLSNTLTVKVIEKVELNKDYISLFTEDIIYFISVGDYFTDYTCSALPSFNWKSMLPDRRGNVTFQVTGEISVDSPTTK